jgi:hypothetical protein
VSGPGARVASVVRGDVCAACGLWNWRARTASGTGGTFSSCRCRPHSRLQRRLGRDCAARGAVPMRVRVFRIGTMILVHVSRSRRQHDAWLARSISRSIDRRGTQFTYQSSPHRSAAVARRWKVRGLQPPARRLSLHSCSFLSHDRLKAWWSQRSLPVAGCVPPCCVGLSRGWSAAAPPSGPRRRELLERVQARTAQTTPGRVGGCCRQEVDLRRTSYTSRAFSTELEP